MPQTAPTYAQFVALFPQFVGPDDNRSAITFQLGLSSDLLSVTAWGDYYQRGVMLECAHNLTLAAVQGESANGAIQTAVGPIGSVSAAGTSTGFNTPALDGKSKSDNWYMKTGYGQQFMRLRDTVVNRGFLSC